MASSIKCRAAIALSPNTALVLEEIEVAAPKAHEVRIKILFTAVCHTDIIALDGNDPEVQFPVILGHESAGVVESVGSEVVSVKAGDHVVPCYVPQCYECKFCKSSKTNLCCVIRETQGKGFMPDGTSRFSSLKHGQLFHFMGISGFSEYTVVPEIAVAKINPAAPLNEVCLLACGVATGYGAVFNTAKVEANSSVAVWGLGAVGLAVILGSRDANASKIIAIDLNEKKFSLAKSFGATHCISPNKISASSVCQELINLTDGGCDYTFECIGNVHTMREALESCHKGWGVSVVLGVAASGKEIATRPFQLVTGRTWKGSAFGGWKSREDVPKLVEKTLAPGSSLELRKFITHQMPIEKVNEVLTTMRRGEVIRCVLSFESC